MSDAAPERHPFASKTPQGKARQGGRGLSKMQRREGLIKRLKRAADLTAQGLQFEDIQDALRQEFGVHYTTAAEDIKQSAIMVATFEAIPPEVRRFKLDQQFRAIANNATRDADRLRALEDLVELWGVSLSKEKAGGSIGVQVNELHVHYETVTPGEQGGDTSTGDVGVLPARIVDALPPAV